MKSVTRIYCVSNGTNDRLIRAGTAAQALRHVAQNTFRTRVATQDDLIVNLTAGGKIEDAGAEIENESTSSPESAE